MRSKMTDAERCARARAGQRRRRVEKPDVVRAYDRARYAKDPLRVKATNLRLNYGISLDDYLAMFEAQRGLCKVCSRPETRTNRGVVMRLAVDHCHTTGKVRGLLCADCNRAIGLLADSPDRLRAAAMYLEEGLT